MLKCRMLIMVIGVHEHLIAELAPILLFPFGSGGLQCVSNYTHKGRCSGHWFFIRQALQPGSMIGRLDSLCLLNKPYFVLHTFSLV